MPHSTPARPPRFPSPCFRGPGSAARVALLTLLAAQAAGAVQPPAAVTLSIVGTTDLHGYVFPREGRGGLAVFGGYLANLRAARQADGGGVVLLDAGDTYLGGVESNMSEGAVVVDAYNALGYTAGALGNHDLEFGAPDRWPFGAATGDPRGAVKMLARQAHYPMLAANLVEATSGAPVAWPNVRPSALVTVAGIRVGLVGVMTYDALSLTLPANVGGLTTTPLVGAIVREATGLRADGAQVVVVVAHAGGACADFGVPDDVTSCDDTAEIVDVARRLPAGLVDVIVAGHTHDAVAHRVAGVAIVQSYSWGRAFSRVDVQISTATGRVAGARIFAPQNLCSWQETSSGECATGPSSTTGAARYEGRDVVPSAAVGEAMAPRLRQVATWRATRVGAMLDAPITRGPGDGESPLGNLFADALAAVAPGADGAFSYGAGPGGLRADLAAGPLTLGALYDLFPFDNRVVSLTLTGAGLRRLLADHLRRPRWRARALGVSGFLVGLSCRGGRDEVEVRRAAGPPPGDDEQLTIVMTDFLAARARSLKLAVEEAGSPLGDVQVRDAALAWVRARPRLAAAAFSVADVPRWSRSDASVAGCASPAQ